MKISIFGMGFVGKAIYHGFSPICDIRMYDIQEGFHSLEETTNHATILFLCVPTPMEEDGKQNLDILEGVVEKINSVADGKKIIIIKSTVLPGTASDLRKRFPNHGFISNPEFLTERTARYDFINANRIILGGSKEDIDFLLPLYYLRFPSAKIFCVTNEEAELVKYCCNCFFAAKVSLMNEIFAMCQEQGFNYNTIKAMMVGDQRIGNSHMDVPGPDGNLGYGGKCFSKDVQAILKWGEERGFPMTMWGAAEEVNTRVRMIRDWENIKGATTKNNY